MNRYDRIADAVVAFSGGQDSTTCLAWAINRWGKDRVDAIGFDYRQRHRIELHQAQQICNEWGIPFTVLSVPAFAELGAAALTNRDIAVSVNAAGTGNLHAEDGGLPSTFVPGRNLIFLGLVAAYAAQHRIPNIVTGVCSADDAGYPDCRPEFIEAFQTAARVAMGFRDDDDTSGLYVHAPLLHLSKAATFGLAADLGVLDTIIEQTHTCYHGNRSTRHPWGYGCGECGACVERAKGFEAFAPAGAEL